MKVAIFHDYFRMIGGAEKLVLLLAKEIGADIITSEFSQSVIKKAGFQGVKIIALGKLTKNPGLLSAICRMRFSNCDFSEKYDYFIFSGTFSIYAASRHKPNMWYCHTPLKGIYPNVFGLSRDRLNSSDPEYQRHAKSKHVTLYSKLVLAKKRIFPKRTVPEWLGSRLDFFFNTLHEFPAIAKSALINRNFFFVFSGMCRRAVINTMAFLSYVLAALPYRNFIVSAKTDQLAIKQINSIVVNSKHMQKIVTRIYKKESSVINPPIFIPSVAKPKKGKYWLSVNRLFPEKRIEVQLDAFRRTRRHLVIIGGHDNHNIDYLNELVLKTSDNVSFIGEVNSEELSTYYENCIGFISTARDEDFGMTVLEAMAYGKPVIAPREGGYAETIVHNRNGILLDRVDAASLDNAIKKIETVLASKIHFFLERNRSRAMHFSDKVFVSRMKEHISRHKS